MFYVILISFDDRCFQTAMLQLHFRNGCYYDIYVDIIIYIIGIPRSKYQIQMFSINPSSATFFVV